MIAEKGCVAGKRRVDHGLGAGFGRKVERMTHAVEDGIFGVGVGWGALDI